MLSHSGKIIPLILHFNSAILDKRPPKLEALLYRHKTTSVNSFGENKKIPRTSARGRFIKMKATQFLKEVRSELEKVVWPTRDDTIKLTIIVVFVALGVGFFIGGIDYLLTQLTSLILK